MAYGKFFTSVIKMIFPFWRQLTGSIGLLIMAGCQTIPLEPSENFVGDHEVTSDYASFYRLGPQQAGGPDRNLRTDEVVMLQRKEFGYSRIQLKDDQTGYIANEDIQPIPPEIQKERRQRQQRERAKPRVVYEDDSYDDLPWQDLNLDIMPEDVPLEPLPEFLPELEELPVLPLPTPEPAPVIETLPTSTPPADTTEPVSVST